MFTESNFTVKNEELGEAEEQKEESTGPTRNQLEVTEAPDFETLTTEELELQVEMRERCLQWQENHLQEE